MTDTEERAGAGISALHARWAAALRQGELDAMLELLTEDYLLWPRGGAEVRGREAVARLLGPALAAYDIEASFESIERVIVEDVAWERGWDVQRVQPRDGSAAVEQRQRVFLLLRRGIDGTWRYARGMSNQGRDA